MQVRDDIPDHNLIVGVTRDSQIHTDTGAFQLFVSGLADKLISVAEAKFMVACNAGPQWEQLLAKAAIFGINEFGVPCFVKGGLLASKEIVPPYIPDINMVEGEVIPAGATA